MRWLSLLLILVVAFSLDAADDPTPEAELRKMIDAHSKLAVLKVTLREYDPPLENGVTASAYVELKDATTTGNPNLVIKRFLSLTRWDAKAIDKRLNGHYTNGWYLPDNLDAAVYHRVLGQFEIGGKIAQVQIPANMSYDFVKECLTFGAGHFEIEKTHEVTWESEAKAVVIRTLLEFKGNLNAKGEIYRIELDDNRRPTAIKKTGMWRA